MRAINPSFLYAVGGIIFAINLLFYPTIVVVGASVGYAYTLKKLFWLAAISFSIPLFWGILVDQRLSITWKVLCLAGVIVAFLLIVFILPFVVRTYMFDLLTTIVSLIGLATLAFSIYLLLTSRVFLN